MRSILAGSTLALTAYEYRKLQGWMKQSPICIRLDERTIGLPPPRTGHQSVTACSGLDIFLLRTFWNHWFEVGNMAIHLDPARVENCEAKYIHIPSTHVECPVSPLCMTLATKIPILRWRDVATHEVRECSIKVDYDEFNLLAARLEARLEASHT